MSDDRDELVEGRVRRGRGPLLAMGMALVLGAVWWVGGRFAGESVVDDEPEPDVSVVEDLPPTGRLVYATDATGGPPDRPQRLVVLALVTGEFTPGPFVPTVEEMVAVGPDRSSLVVVTDLGAEGAPRLVGERVVAWSPDGDRVTVVGTVEGRRSMWLVETEGGSAVRLFPAGAVPSSARSSGASFDAEGRVFAVADGALVVSTSDGVEGSVPLPVGAPRLNGPVVWLP